MNSDSQLQSGAAVSSSELVVLLDRWNQDVIKWERAADNTEPDSWTVRDRCRARASEIARCRRELAQVIKQHNVDISGPARQTMRDQFQEQRPSEPAQAGSLHGVVKRHWTTTQEDYVCSVCGVKTKTHLKARGTQRVVNLHNDKHNFVCASGSWKTVPLNVGDERRAGNERRSENQP